MTDLHTLAADWKTKAGLISTASPNTKAAEQAGVAFAGAVADLLQPPTTPPTPPPSPTSTLRVGVSNNLGGGGSKQHVLDLGAKLIREDHGELVQPWASQNGITVITIAALDANAAGVAACPVADLANEPYNNNAWINGDPLQFYRAARDCAHAIKTKYGTAKTVLLPIGPPWNNGNVLVNGGWMDCVLAANMAAPDIWESIDGLSVHPYSQPGAAVPGRFPVLDKWRAAAKQIGPAADKPYWVTEYGRPTGGSSWPKPDGTAYTEQEQLDYFVAYHAEVAKRGDIAVLVVYRLDEYGARDANSEHWFGLLRPDGSPKPAYAAVRSRVVANP